MKVHKNKLNAAKGKGLCAHLVPQEPTHTDPQQQGWLQAHTATQDTAMPTWVFCEPSGCTVLHPLLHHPTLSSWCCSASHGSLASPAEQRMWCLWAHYLECHHLGLKLWVLPTLPYNFPCLLTSAEPHTVPCNHASTSSPSPVVY